MTEDKWNNCSQAVSIWPFVLLCCLFSHRGLNHNELLGWCRAAVVTPEASLSLSLVQISRAAFKFLYLVPEDLNGTYQLQDQHGVKGHFKSLLTHISWLMWSVPGFWTNKCDSFQTLQTIWCILMHLIFPNSIFMWMHSYILYQCQARRLELHQWISLFPLWSTPLSDCHNLGC